MNKEKKNAGKVIISCAVTGAIHTPSMSPHLPVTPEEIISDSLAAAEAGAGGVWTDLQKPLTLPQRKSVAFMQHKQYLTC